MAVLVAGHRPDVVGRDHAPASVVEPAQDEDDAEMRQLVVGQPDRRPAERVEDLIERVGMDRRGQAVADRRGPDRDPGRRAPGVGGRWSDSSWASRTVVVRADRRRRRLRAGRATPGQPSSDACGSQSKVSSSPASSTTPDWSAAGSRAARSSSVDLPTCCASRRDDDRDPRLDEQPERSRRARHRARPTRSARRSSAARAGRDGMPSGPARARCRPRAEPRTAGQSGQTGHDARTA